MSVDEENQQQALRDLQGEHFQRLAEAADAIADAAEASARVHDQIAERLPGAAEHAARDRHLAAAEREAAEAFRAHEVPSQAVREVIRTSGTGTDAQTPTGAPDD